MSYPYKIRVSSLTCTRRAEDVTLNRQKLLVLCATLYLGGDEDMKFWSLLPASLI